MIRLNLHLDAAHSAPSQPNRTDRGFFTPYLAALPHPAAFPFFPRPPPVFYSDFYTDTPVTDQINLDLRVASATWLRDKLRENGVDEKLLEGAFMDSGASGKDSEFRGAGVRIEFADATQ